MKQWTERDATARSGIVKLDRVVTDMGYIWRPTPNSDVGIAQDAYDRSKYLHRNPQ